MKPIPRKARMAWRESLAASLSIVLLAACGGGGGDADSHAVKTVTEAPSPTLAAASAIEGAASATSAASAASAADLAAHREDNSAHVANRGASATLVSQSTASFKDQAAEKSLSFTSSSSSPNPGSGNTGVASASSSNNTAQASATFTNASNANQPATRSIASINAGEASSSPAARPAGEITIHVDTAGDDTANGSTLAAGSSTGPVRTLARAQALARSVNAKRSFKVPVRVMIGPGEYDLSMAPLVFTTADSGTAAAPVEYTARTAGTVLLTGGINLGAASTVTGQTYATFPRAIDASLAATGGQLYVNGRRSILARQPNTNSFWFVQRPVVLTTDPAGQEGTAAFAPPSDAMKWMNSLSVAERARAVIDVQQSWSNGRHRLVNISSAPVNVQISPRARWPFLNFGLSQRFHIENVLAAFDAPGEWIQAGEYVRYMKRADDPAGSIVGVRALAQRLLVVQGDTVATPVQYLRFTGLGFAYTNEPTPAGGQFDTQAAQTIGAAIEVNKAKNIQFTGIDVSRTGGWGLWLREWVRESVVTGSRFTDLGAGGVRVGMISQDPNDTRATGSNELSNNVVSHTGKLYPGATAIWLGQTWDNRVVQNTVHSTSYSGISVGWQWGYASATSGRNLISGNLLFGIGQRQLADLGGIYTLGRSPGTVISNNIIREVRGYPDYGPEGVIGAWGIYLDEGSSEILVERNIVVGTDSGALHLHYGRNNTVRHNIFAAGDGAELRVSRTDRLTNLRFSNNLLFPAGNAPFQRFAQSPDVIFSSVLVSDQLAPRSTDLTNCSTACARTSQLSLAIDPDALNIRVLGASDWSRRVEQVTAQAGQRLTTAAESVAARTTANIAATQAATSAPSATLLVTTPAEAPVAPPLHLLVDVANTSLTAKPINLKHVPGPDLESIRVVSNASFSSGRCLNLQDGPLQTRSWEPFVVASLNHRKGNTVVEFEVQPDVNSQLIHEWRDVGTPYLTGPSLTITADSVMAGKRRLGSLTPGVVSRFRVSSPLGTANAKWRVEVTQANGKGFVADGLAQSNADWRRLDQLLFISNGTVAAKTCIGNITATPTEP